MSSSGDCWAQDNQYFHYSCHLNVRSWKKKVTDRHATLTSKHFSLTPDMFSAASILSSALLSLFKRVFQPKYSWHCSAMAANVQEISARMNFFSDQIQQHILSFVPRSSELASQYSFQPQTGHYLVKAGWPAVLKKVYHWKEADTICICCGSNKEPGDPNESDNSYTSQQVSAGWAKVMTVTIPHFRHHHMKFLEKQLEA